MSEEKKVYNSISELAEKKVVDENTVNEVSADAVPFKEARSEDLQIIDNLDEIAPMTPRDDKMVSGEEGFWASIDEELDKSFKDTDKLLNEALDKKALEMVEKEDEKILNGEDEDYEEDDYEDEGFDEDFDLGDELESDYSYEESTKKVVKVASNSPSENNIFDDYKVDDFSDKDLEEEDFTDNEDEEMKTLKAIQDSIKGQIKPINNPVDLSLFRFSKKHISANKAIDIAQDETTVEWVLYNTGKKITMREFKGYEIEMLNQTNSNGRTRFKVYQDIYKLIYSHVVDNNKVPFEAWLKSIKASDIDDLYFAIYKACFVGANTIPFSCPKQSCKNIFMKEIPIENMVKYKNDSVKERVEEILNGEYSVDGTEEVEVVMVSDKYAIGLKSPSIYNILFETTILDEKFTEKYASFLGFMSFIDEIYYIDKNNQELVPIDISISDIHNTTKAIKNKVLQYSKIIRTLTSDQFSNLQAQIFRIQEAQNVIEYVLPETTCPKCASVVKEESITPEQMVFTRRQLLLIANSSIN